MGFFKNRRPGIILREPELIEDVLVKHFSNFHDNDIDIKENVDPLFARNPFVLRGDKWKITRNQIMSCFTNTKVKSVYPLIEANARKLVHYLEKLGEDENSAMGIEAKELSAKYTIENVASCAFGLEGNAFENPNAEFITIAKKIINPSFWIAIRHLIIMIEPTFASIVDVK